MELERSLEAAIQTTLRTLELVAGGDSPTKNLHEVHDELAKAADFRKCSQCCRWYPKQYVHMPNNDRIDSRNSSVKCCSCHMGEAEHLRATTSTLARASEPITTCNPPSDRF